jgi:hypothetical protein
MSDKRGSSERIFEASCQYGDEAVERALREASRIDPNGPDKEYVRYKNRGAHKKLIEQGDFDAAEAFEVIFILPEGYF